MPREVDTDPALICSSFMQCSSLVNKVNPDQARKLLAVLQGTGGAAAEVTANGFVISGVRYALVRAELDEECELRYLVGRCKQFGAPVQGIIIVPTYRALLFAVHDPLHSPDLSFGRANVTMTCLAEELMSQNI